MYLGEHSTSLDDKGRITVPRRFREAMDVYGHQVWYLTRGFDGCIFLFHRDEWNRIRAHIGRRVSIDGKALDFRRLFFGSVAEAKPDPQGRLGVPSHLREYAGLEKEAVLLGIDDHLELWSRDAWRAFQEGKQAEYKEMASLLFGGAEPQPAATEKGGLEHDH
ncbi:MAG: division/cell wall cluster transcriptional repressor MraZ [Candidatus Hydrogenedentes bacterium]|nr:division/cell wall cluster transcriptional repressor MraZ [Candidatus Hydrogenedentota bacterium]